MKKHILNEVKLSKEEVIQLRKTQLEILDFFCDFCEKNNLKYYLFGGTLLGAVRHKGYIPWDDDLDLCMPYEDYAKMLKLFPKDGNFFLEDVSTDKHYFHSFAKIMKANTVYREYRVQNVRYRQSIFIDIFPIIYVPNSNNLAYFNFCLAYELLSIRLQPKLIKMPSDKKTSLKRKAAICLSWLLLWWCPKTIAAKLRYKLIDHYGKKETNTISVGMLLTGHRYPSSAFSGLSKVEFEGRMLSAPENYDEYLNIKFGEYMELPPLENREAHHYLVEFKAD